MDKLVYSDSFIIEAQKLLREMIEHDLEMMSFGKPFENMSVMIGNPADKMIVALVDIPDDLMEKIGNRKVYVVT